MHIIILALISLFFSCASEVKTPKLYSLPPTKSSRPDLVEKTMFSLGLMTDYEIWEFLKENPSEKDVLDTFGFPDSVWLDDGESTKYLYYFISEMQDYNTIEISARSDSVSGFEWD